MIDIIVEGINAEEFTKMAQNPKIVWTPTHSNEIRALIGTSINIGHMKQNTSVIWSIIDDIPIVTYALSERLLNGLTTKASHSEDAHEVWERFIVYLSIIMN